MPVLLGSGQQVCSVVCCAILSPILHGETIGDKSLLRPARWQRRKQYDRTECSPLTQYSRSAVIDPQEGLPSVPVPLGSGQQACLVVPCAILNPILNEATTGESLLLHPARWCQRQQQQYHRTECSPLTEYSCSAALDLQGGLLSVPVPLGSGQQVCSAVCCAILRPILHEEMID